MRPSSRAAAELRPIRITRQFTKHAEGAVLVEFGDTRVICTASVEERVPPFLKGKGRGWVTAELRQTTGILHNAVAFLQKAHWGTCCKRTRRARHV